MPSARRRKLDALVAQIQMEHGPRALRRPEKGERAPSAQRIATGFPQLDALLDGGLPRGRISEICGPPTCGKLTLAAQVVAAAHRQSDAFAVWSDPTRTCDPATLHRCGVDLSRLVVLHPDTLANGLLMTTRALQSRALAVLTFDLPAGPDEAERWDEGQLAGALAQINTVLAEISTAVLFVTEPERSSRALAHAAAVRILLTRQQWLTRRRDPQGYESVAEVVKNRLGPTGSARIAIRHEPGL